MIYKMAKKIKNIFINLEKNDLKIMQKGLHFSLLFIFFSSLLLMINLLFLHNFNFYNLGISLVKSGLYFTIDFIICGIVINGIKNNNL